MSPWKRISQDRRAAFTLLEILCVIAMVAILSALVFPAVSATQRAAKKARTRVQFAEWVAAIEGFRGEYGHYPEFDATNLVNGGAGATVHPFHDLLAGRRRDGSPNDPEGAAARQNRKAIRFLAIRETNFDGSALLHDAFGNTEIAVLVDRDLDGIVKVGADFAALPAVGGLVPAATDFPAAGIRASVILYAPVPGATAAAPEFVTSWQ
jgi:prepilin-type N-terminal cleavage/methylation domain-containing protein